MEPNKLEKHFKTQLEQRTIQPSEMAWDRLDAMLAVKEEKKKRSFGWLYIAASFLGLLLVATVFFSQTDEIIDIKKEDGIVLGNNVVKDTLEKEETVTPEITTPKVIQNEKQSVANGGKVLEQQNPIKNPKEILPVNNQNQIAEKSNSIISQKTQQQVNQKPTYVNVDELLASVESPKKERLFKETSSVKVDAHNLLTQVDGELELTFREKVIKSVNKNYKTVRVALSNRNTQE